MSKERRLARKALAEYRQNQAADDIPHNFNVQDAADTVVYAHEASFWESLSMMYLRFRAAGMHRQADIVQQDLQTEQKRTDDNKNHWAVENGQIPPSKSVDWGDV